MYLIDSSYFSGKTESISFVWRERWIYNWIYYKFQYFYHFTKFINKVKLIKCDLDPYLVLCSVLSSWGNAAACPIEHSYCSLSINTEPEHHFWWLLGAVFFKSLILEPCANIKVSVYFTCITKYYMDFFYVSFFLCFQIIVIRFDNLSKVNYYFFKVTYIIWKLHWRAMACEGASFRANSSLNSLKLR